MDDYTYGDGSNPHDKRAVNCHTTPHNVAVIGPVRAGFKQEQEKLFVYTK